MSLIAKDTWRRWVNGVIPFRDDPSLNADPTLQTAVGQARQAWAAVTPVRFVPQSNEPDFIVFKRVQGTPRCTSFAGRQGGAQDLKCDTGFTLGALVHEIGHAIGLWHEHQRPDRDAVMAVSQAACEQRPQDFIRLPNEQMVGPYDLNSVMHYPWSTNVSLEPISKIPPIPPPTWPDPQKPSDGDAEGVRFMYGIVPDHTPIAALRRADWHMELWVVGGDEVVRGAWFDGMWRTWYQLHERTFPQRGHLAVLSRNESHMEVFGIGKDAQLHAIFYDGQWREWHTLGAPTIPGLITGLTTALTPGGPLAVRSRKSNHEEV
jgi:Astacin (Peptidase family M12A)